MPLFGWEVHAFHIAFVSVGVFGGNDIQRVIGIKADAFNKARMNDIRIVYIGVCQLFCQHILLGYVQTVVAPHQMCKVKTAGC